LSPPSSVLPSTTLFRSGDNIKPNFGWYVFCGCMWGLSMIVPGLSSSSVLLFMGLYQTMAAGIAKLDMAVCIPLGIGFLLTLAARSEEHTSELQSRFELV